MNLQSQLDQILLDLPCVKVESTLMIGAITLLLFGLIFKNAYLHKGVYMLTLIVAFVRSLEPIETGLILSESLFISDHSHAFGSLFLLVLGLVVIFPTGQRTLCRVLLFYSLDGSWSTVHA